MFSYTMEPRTENKNSSLENTVVIMWAQICGIIVNKKKSFFFCKLGPQGGIFLQYVICDAIYTYFFVNIKLRPEKNN